VEALFAPSGSIGKPWRLPRHFQPVQRSLPSAAVSRIAEGATLTTEPRQRTVVFTMIGATMNEISGHDGAGQRATFYNLTARLLGLGYPIAAAALRFKNKPTLRPMTVIFAAILLATTLLSSSHVSGLSLLPSLSFLAVNLFQILLMLWACGRSPCRVRPACFVISSFPT
jgi:hypothetical protein